MFARANTHTHTRFAVALTLHVDDVGAVGRGNYLCTVQSIARRIARLRQLVLVLGAAAY